MEARYRRFKYKSSRPSFKESTQLTSGLPGLVIDNSNTERVPQKPLNIAAMNGEVETVLKLLDSGANPEEKDGLNGNTGLHWAVRAKQTAVLDIYKERGFDLSATNDLGWAPIHVAAEGYLLCKSLEWLLNNGVDIETEDSWGQTPLYKAAFKGKISAAKILLSYGASPNYKDSKRRTPMNLAVLNDHIEMVKLLFDHGADLQHIDNWGRNFLHTAKSIPLMEWLVEHNVDINGKDDWGRTPLHDAVQDFNPENASFLLEKGADIEAKDRNGCTPLYEAAKTGKVEFVRLFLKKGADPESTAKDGSTPAEVASDEMIKNLLLHKKGSAKMN